MGHVLTARALEAEQRRAHIWNSVLAGKDQIEIGKELGITQQAVSKQVAKSVHNWQTSTLCKVDQYIANELLRISYAESQAWKVHAAAEKAWTASIGTRQIVNRKARPVPVVREGRPVMLPTGLQQTTMEPQSMEVKEETHTGNPQFLKIMLEAQASAMACAAERRKLLGLDKPQQFKVQFPTLAEIENMTDDQLIEAVAVGAYQNSEVAAKLKGMFLMPPKEAKVSVN